MPANVQSMAYYGAPPWHKLGTPVPLGVTAAEMICAAGLNWEVEVRPARGARIINKKKKEYSRYEVVRVPRPSTEETEVLLGVVSRRYHPLQNIEAFEFFDPIVGQGKAHFETAGALGEGERIWVLSKMPGAMEVVPGDECMKYLLLSNSHTGDGSVIVKFTPIRVVCQNTLIMSLNDGQKAYRVRHSKKMQFKLSEISEFLALTQEVFLKGQEIFRRLAKIEMTGDRLEKYFGAVYPATDTQKKKGEKPERWRVLKELFESRPDLQIAKVSGTLWAAYNAITYLEDYKEPNHSELEDQRLQRAWFGGGADLKLKALEKATELASNWA